MVYVSYERWKERLRGETVTKEQNNSGLSFGNLWFDNFYSVVVDGVSLASHFLIIF